MVVLESMAPANENNKSVFVKKRKKELVVPVEAKKVKENEAEETIKVPINFSVKDFRIELRGTDGLKWLRDFANAADSKLTETNVVLDFLRLGGTVGEITSILDVTAQGDLVTALPVFRAVTCILLEIQDKGKEYYEAAKNDIEKLMSTYVATIQAMINMNSPKHRKVALKLLSAVVTFHPPLGSQILNWFSLTPQQQEAFTEPGPLRKAFIWFLMPFFLNGKMWLFRPLIDKKGLLSIIMPNLKFDDANTVVIVLGILKEKLILNNSVPKTMKLNIFNTQTLQSLFQLFDWVGPKGAQKGWKRPLKLAPVDEEALQQVSVAVDEFLTTLCTCKKNGVVFWDKTIGSGPPMNQLVFTALEVIKKPWEKPIISKLVLNILKACPDLIKGCLTRWEPSIEPRLTEGWVQVIDFLISVVESLDPEVILTPAVEGLSPSQLTNAIRGLLVSQPVTKHLSAALNAEKDPLIQCHGYRLLNVIAKKMKGCFTVLPTVKKYENCRENLKNVMHGIIPPSKSIVKLWSEEINGEGDINLPSGKELILADCLLSLASLDPFLLDNPRRLCRALAKDVVTRSEEIQSALLQVIVILDPSYLQPETEEFQEALRILLHLTTEKSSRQNCLYTIANMLLNTGVWDTQIHTLDSWLGSWLLVAEKGRTAVSKFLASTVQKVAEERSLNSDDQSSVLTHAWTVLDDIGTELKKTERKELSMFLTRVTLQTCFISNEKLKITEDMTHWLLLDIPKCLKGDLDSVCKIPDPLVVSFTTWLLSDDDTEINLAVHQPDIFEWSSLLNTTLHSLRTFISKNKFNDIRQKKCRQSILFILQNVCPEETFKKEVSGDSLLSLEPSSKVFFKKAITLLVGSSALVERFSVFEENVFTSWLRGLFQTLKLEKWQLFSKLGIEWKIQLLKELKTFIKNRDSHLPVDFQYWISLCRPSIQDLLPVIQLLLQTDYTPAIGNLWVIVLKLVDRKTLQRDDILSILQHLWKGSLTCLNYDEALDHFVHLYPGIVLEIPKDFLEKVINSETVGPSLISVSESCLKESSHRQAVRQIFKSKGIKKTMNARALIAILGHGFLGKKGDENSETTNADAKLMTDCIPLLAPIAWRIIKPFLKGEEDSLLTKNLALVKKILTHIDTSDSPLKSSLEKLFTSKVPRPELLPVAASVAYRTDKTKIVDWLENLCLDSENEKSENWKESSMIAKALVKDATYSKQIAKFRKTDVWKTFVNNTLRSLSVNSNPCRWSLLQSITSAAANKKSKKEHFSHIFHKCTSHSEFLNVLLSNASVKGELMGVLLELVKLDESVMMLGHVPTYLAAYSATLSTSDCRLLQLLIEYEKHSGSLLKFEPLFWGEAAISHYSVKGTGGLSLWKQVTMKSVLEILDFKKVCKTICKFPIHRTLYGDVVFSDPDLYDPAFLIPLFSTLLSPGAVSYCLSFVHSGALSLTIAALSSSDEKMRGAAAVVLHRFHSHLHLTVHSKQKPVWLHVVDIIRFGLENLEASPIPGIMSVFLARSALEIADASSPLNMLHKYLIAKPSFNLYCLPEFDHLFFSADINYLSHRKWVLEVLRDGIKRDSDSNLLIRGSAFQLLLAIFSLDSTPMDHKIVILEIAEKVVRTGPTGRKVVSSLGLPSWIRSISWEIATPMLPAFYSLLEAIEESFDNMEKKANLHTLRGDRERIRTVHRILEEKEQQLKSSRDE